MSYRESIRIGTLAKGSKHTAEYLTQILPHGFESFQITFWQTNLALDLKRMAKEVKAALADSGAIISSLGVFGNPLATDQVGKDCVQSWRRAIDHAAHFGCDIVAGFTGADSTLSVPDNIKRFKQVFTPLVKRAADKGIRIAFENCPMNGSWKNPNMNIATNPAAWELMFDAIPADNLGLEWEPCHQLCQLIDPMPQLREWMPKIFHVHGKDATIHRDVVERHGIISGAKWKAHRHPGFGDSNWTDIISDLRRGGFTGSIDIEGWHDPVYKGEFEMTGQVHALNYLKHCRTTYVPNPTVA